MNSGLRWSFYRKPRLYTMHLTVHRCWNAAEVTSFTSSLSRFCVPSSLSPCLWHHMSVPVPGSAHPGNKARRTTPHERNRRMTEGVWMCLALRPNRFSSLCCMQIGTMKKWAAKLMQDRLWLKAATRASNRLWVKDTSVVTWGGNHNKFNDPLNDFGYLTVLFNNTL